MTLPAIAESLIEGPFAVAVTIRRSGGGDSKVLRCLWDRGELSTRIESMEDGEPTVHRTAAYQATFATSKVADTYGEGDEVVKDGVVYTIADAADDGEQTTYTLTA